MKLVKTANGTIKNIAPMEIVIIVQNLCQMMIVVRIGKELSRMNEIEKAIEELDIQTKATVNATSIKTCRLPEALQKQLKLKELGFTDEVIENYRKFEDECIVKGFTFKSLIEAREKQIPKKPIRVSNSRTDGCPECKTEYYEKFKYCPECGVKLDWSVEE